MFNQYKYVFFALFFAITTQASQTVSLMDRKSPEFHSALEKEKAAIAKQYGVKKTKKTASAMRFLVRAVTAQPIITGAVVGLASGAVHKDYMSGALYGASAGCVVSLYTKKQSSTQIISSITCTAVSRSNYEPNEHLTRNQASAIAFVTLNATWNAMDYFFGSNDK
jgi:hypothetical protein